MKNYRPRGGRSNAATGAIMWPRQAAMEREGEELSVLFACAGTFSHYPLVLSDPQKRDYERRLARVLAITDSVWAEESLRQQCCGNKEAPAEELTGLLLDVVAASTSPSALPRVLGLLMAINRLLAAWHATEPPAGLQQSFGVSEQAQTKWLEQLQAIRKRTACKDIPGGASVCVSLLSLQLVQMEAAIVCLPVKGEQRKAMIAAGKAAFGVAKSVLKMKLDDDLLPAMSDLASAAGKWARRKFAAPNLQQLMRIEQAACNGRLRTRADVPDPIDPLDTIAKLVGDCFGGGEAEAALRWEAKAGVVVALMDALVGRAGQSIDAIDARKVQVLCLGEPQSGRVGLVQMLEHGSELVDRGDTALAALAHCFSFLLGSAPGGDEVGACLDEVCSVLAAEVEGKVVGAARAAKHSVLGAADKVAALAPQVASGGARLSERLLELSEPALVDAAGQLVSALSGVDGLLIGLEGAVKPMVAVLDKALYLIGAIGQLSDPKAGALAAVNRLLGVLARTGFGGRDQKSHGDAGESETLVGLGRALGTHIRALHQMGRQGLDAAMYAQTMEGCATSLAGCLRGLPAILSMVRSLRYAAEEVGELRAGQERLRWEVDAKMRAFDERFDRIEQAMAMALKLLLEQKAPPQSQSQPPSQPPLPQPLPSPQGNGPDRLSSSSPGLPVDKPNAPP